ncbi:MAG TPA: hypothetical protein VFJ82_26985 [Longimicrobium sp.]|nr:hypothetical protein [Longimicrobium sp.]
MERRFDALLAPPVLASLALLLANDFALKPAYHNALTGKLSDVAGLFVFVVFWCAVFPRARTAVAVLTAIGFVFWKSPAAQPLIDAWNALGLLPVRRVVDATDLAALLVVPSAWAYRPRPAHPTRLRRLLAPVAAAACIFAFGATSTLAHVVPIPETTYTLELSRGEVLRRIYDLRLSFRDEEAPPPQSAAGPDSISVLLPPDGPGDTLHAWGALSVRAAVADRPGGGSTLALVSAASHDRGMLQPDRVRARFERQVVERLRRNEPNRVHVAPYVAGTQSDIGPAIVAPRSLAESRAQVTISLRLPAYVALVEITPDDEWRLLYPARPEDERRLPAGTHTLATACAAEPAAAPLPPTRAIPPCALARPVTPREVATVTRTPTKGCHTGEVRVAPGSLALIATDVPLPRAAVQAQVEGYCGYTYFFDPGFSPLVKAVRAAGGRRWAAVEVYLRR